MSTTSAPDNYAALAQLPTPETVTLLLKCHKSTTLLSVQPTTSFTEIKGLLIAALRSRNRNTLPGSSTPLPQNADDLEFGVLADKKDITKGWTLLEIQEQEVNNSKGNKHKVGGKGSIVNHSPSGAGLGDGAWIAYRLKWISKQGIQEEQDLELESTDVELEEDPGWDVVLPTFEDEPE